ncbi:hypothetical protein EW145_g6966 [Phellinidium pouzarii]|uniref:UBC core domain-containing protein n=1 Tax=Phellinidium pouzarii TaxID=167371 RepID=A0A4S4KT17_9AGAM|nr:hypothetical protein EW145_g6966 [Phellinidium pouzarii]
MATSTANILLARQLKDLLKEPVEGFSVGLKEDNFLEWRVAIIGPPDTLHEGGVYTADLTFTTDFPNKPPTMRFITPIWHPNIYPNGLVCISILHPPEDDQYGYEDAGERWLPVHSVESIRVHRRTLLNYTNTVASSPDAPNALNTLLSLPLIPTPPASPPHPSSPLPSPGASPGPSSSALVVRPHPRVVRPDLSAAKKARCARYANYVPEEETIRNDYSQRYVDGGEWPQNWVIGAEMERRFEEYPKQQRLLSLKKASVAEYALPPTYLSMSTAQSAFQGLKFDSILIDPPFSSSFTWEQLETLPIQALAADPSYVFLWVGSGAGEGLERGREILGKWGYRRCEDIVWVKTNNESNKGPGTDPPTTSLLTRTKQHCLMGIRGTVRRSTDSWFVHCNIDTDVIIWEGDPSDPTRKPPEMYQLIENFCLGTRRLEIFGRYHSLRRGWVTVTSDELSLTPEETREMDNATPFDKEKWDAQIKELAMGGKYVVPNTSEIESLRPKSPPPRGSGGGNTMVSAAPMSAPSNNLPSNPTRGGGGGGPGGGGMNGNNGMGGPKQSFNPQIMAQPMNMMGMNQMGGMGNMGSVGVLGPGNMGGNMGGMGGMGGMGNMGAMGNMGNAMNWPMHGSTGMNTGMAGNMGPGMGGMMNNNNMNMPMNAPLGGHGTVNFAFEGAAGAGRGMGPGAGMMTMPNGMNRNMGQGMEMMNQGMANMGQMHPGIGMGPVPVPQLGFGGFDNGQGAWMNGGLSGFNNGGMGQQQFMGAGRVWDGNLIEGEGGMGMVGMGGMPPGMNQGMRQWRNF